MNKIEILNRLCYTELVYGRINKKLKTNLSKPEIEELMERVIRETEERFFEKIGKNYYVTNSERVGESCRPPCVCWTYRCK